MERGRWSLRWIVTGLVVALLFLLSASMVLVTRDRLEKGIERELETRAESLANLLARATSTELAVGANPDPEDLESIRQERDVVFVAVADARGRLLDRAQADALGTSSQAIVAFAESLSGGGGSVPGTNVFVARADVSVQRADMASAVDEYGLETAPAAPATPRRTRQVHLGRAYVAVSKTGLERELADATALVVTVTLCFWLVGSLVAFLLARSVTRPLGDMVEMAVAMSHGDYDKVGAVRSRTKEVADLADAFAVMRESLAMVASQARSIAAGDLSRRVSGAGQLGDAFNAMVESLSKLVGQIKKASIQIASASSEILAASKHSERGSAEQASSINQTTTTMDELLSASKQIATSADSVVKIAERTLTAAQAGEEAVKQGISGMEEIASNNRQTAERILELSERNQQIGNIVDLIDEIADKSDLLALNAAIEGAKAGEAGKGFAVVATEMRALAENVVESTKEIKALISEIQKASNASVLATEGQMKATERGTQVAVRTGEQLQKILQMVEQTTEAAKQISLATQQQRTGTEQVVHSMSEIAKIAKSNVVGAGQTTASTVELAELADDLKSAVSQFRLGSES